MSYQDVGSMRTAISEVYRSPRWRQKVSWMSDNQVIAIYYSFLEKGKFDRGKRREAPIIEDKFRFDGDSEDRVSTCEEFHQITFDEILKT